MPGPLINVGTLVPPSVGAPLAPRSGHALPSPVGPLSDVKIIIVLSYSPVSFSLATKKILYPT